MNVNEIRIYVRRAESETGKELKKASANNKLMSSNFQVEPRRRWAYSCTSRWPPQLYEDTVIQSNKPMIL